MAPLAPFVDASRLDRNVKPCADFYAHACGGWIAATPSSPERPRVQLANDLAATHQEAVLRAVLEGNDQDTAEVERLRTFFASCVNAAGGTDRTRAEVLNHWLSRIDAARTKSELATVWFDLMAHQIDVFFWLVAGADLQDPRANRLEIHPGALADLPVAARFEVLRRAGLPERQARHDAEAARGIDAALLAIEIPYLFYEAAAQNPMTAATLAEQAPHLEAGRLIAATGYPADRRLNVLSPAYLRRVDDLWRSRSRADLAAYLRWSVALHLERATPRSGDVDTVRRACRDATTLALGVEFSRAFATRVLAPQDRDRARKAAQTVVDAIAKSAAAATWLGPAARQANDTKLRQLLLLVGYPDAWPPTQAGPVAPDTFMQNLLHARRIERGFEWQRARSERHNERGEIFVHPNVGPGMAAARLTANTAFPNVFSNSMIVAAGWLAPPHFDKAAPIEATYGTLGYLVGHELVHMLESHEFDATGAMREIWSEDEMAQWHARRQCGLAEGEAFDTGVGVKLNAEFTLDENIADIGGVAFAYRALQASVGDRLAERDADGLSRAQRFFYAYAHEYCIAQTPQAARQALQNEGHPPERMRVNVPLANLPAFAEAFHCQLGDPMTRTPEQRCAPW